MRYQNILFTILLFSLFKSAVSQDIKLGKSTIRPDEEFTIILTFPKEDKKALKSFSFPEIQNFIKVRTQYEEDKKSKIYKVTQSYKPLKAGKFKLQAFKINVEEIEFSSQGTSITVLNVPSRKPETEFQNIEFKSENEEILFRVSSDKNPIYVGEGFTLTASLLIGENNQTGFNFFDLNEQILNLSRSLATTNCLIDEYSKGMIEQLQFDSVRIDTKLYKRLKLFETQAYPVNALNFKFPSVEFKILTYRTARDKNDILWKAEELKLTSAPLKIRVKELPEHPLKDKVPVGVLQLKESISSGKVKTGKSFRYRISIVGNGNLSTVMAPQIKENENLDFYSPEIKQFTSIKDGIRTGQKIFTYDIIPKEPGSYLLSDYFQWIYFNPLKNNYDTLRAKIKLTAMGESLKNKEISSTDLGSFYELAGEESNQLRSKEKDQSIKFFANIIILFMLVTTAILIFRR